MCARCWRQNLEGLENAGNISPAGNAVAEKRVGACLIAVGYRLVLPLVSSFSSPRRSARTCFSRPSRSGSADGSIADSCRSRFLSEWVFASWRPREVRDSAIRSGSTACSRRVVRPIFRPWMRRSTRFFREPRARRRHQCRITCQTKSIAPAQSVSAPKGSLAPRRSATRSRHLRSLSRRHRRDASDVGYAGASHRYRLLQPFLRKRRLWSDARGAHGDLASMTPGIGKAWRISNQGKRPTFRVAPPRREWRATAYEDGHYSFALPL